MEEPDLQLAAARSALNSWLKRAPHDPPIADQALADMAEAELQARHGYQLHIAWNPSACSHDARWIKDHRTPLGLERPHSADEREGARLLACVGLLKFIALQTSTAMRKAG